MLDAADYALLTPEEAQRALELVRGEELRDRQSLFFKLFPGETLYAPDGSVAAIQDGENTIQLFGRNHYPKHLEFFEKGKTYRERGAVCANRVGKTLSMGGFEMSCHLTGLYPDWWPGRRFTKPVRAWAAGKTNETTRDIVQRTLLGDTEGSAASKRLSGTGIVPGWLLGRPKWKQGSPDLVDTIRVKHVTGKWSTLGLKSYEQGRGAFEGTAQDVIWPDEEPPMEIYMECLTRTATTNGMIMCTFTALDGMTETVMLYYPTEV